MLIGKINICILIGSNLFHPFIKSLPFLKHNEVFLNESVKPAQVTSGQMVLTRSPGPDIQAALDERSGEIFRRIVESYLESGEPLGSRNLSRILPMSLSPASVRNVMSDLEELGLIYSPHTSAGRLPTQLGLRFFVDAFMQSITFPPRTAPRSGGMFARTTGNIRPSRP